MSPKGQEVSLCFLSVGRTFPNTELMEAATRTEWAIVHGILQRHHYGWMACKIRMVSERGTHLAMPTCCVAGLVIKALCATHKHKERRKSALTDILHITDMHN